MSGFNIFQQLEGSHKKTLVSSATIKHSLFSLRGWLRKDLGLIPPRGVTKIYNYKCMFQSWNQKESEFGVRKSISASKYKIKVVAMAKKYIIGRTPIWHFGVKTLKY